MDIALEARNRDCELKLLFEELDVAVDEMVGPFAALVDERIVHVELPHAGLALAQPGEVGIVLPQGIGRGAHVGLELAGMGAVQIAHRGGQHQHIARALERAAESSRLHGSLECADFTRDSGHAQPHHDTMGRGQTLVCCSVRAGRGCCSGSSGRPRPALWSGSGARHSCDDRSLPHALYARTFSESSRYFPETYGWRGLSLIDREWAGMTPRSAVPRRGGSDQTGRTGAAEGREGPKSFAPVRGRRQASHSDDVAVSGEYLQLISVQRVDSLQEYPDSLQGGIPGGCNECTHLP